MTEKEIAAIIERLVDGAPPAEMSEALTAIATLCTRLAEGALRASAEIDDMASKIADLDRKVADLGGDM